MFYAASLIVVWAIARAFERRSAAAAYVLMLCPSFLLWCAVLYGIATPLHLWLPMETLFAMALAPCVAAAAALWIAAHRRAAARTVAAAMVTIVSFEIALRVFNYFNPTAIFYTDSYSRYRGRPGAPLMDSHLNSRGFNDVEHDLSKPSHVYRIAAIGDSVAFGVVPYRANYLTLLETELAADRLVEVINLGVPGTEPKDYLAILLQEALAFTPDLVMVGFFIGNDFESAARKPHEHSYVATYLYFLWRLWSVGTPAMVRFDSSADSYDDHAASLSSDRFLEIEVERAWIYSQAEPVLQNALTRAVGYLRDIRDISQRAGANVLVVLIPDEVQVDDGLQEQVARAHGSTRDRFDFHLPNRLLAMALAKEGIPFLDLLPAFAEAGQHTRLYKPRDTHWNLAGNRLAAATIAGFLREHGPQVMRAR
jgi:lysophospholipase L1-like esterase